jgi:hypothetical protein
MPTVLIGSDPRGKCLSDAASSGSATIAMPE